jgi:hypothetical protein
VTAYAQPMADPTSITGRRIGAWVIDLLIYLVIGFAISTAVGASQAENVKREFSTSTEAEAFCDAWRADNQGFCFHSSDGETATAQTIGIETGGLFWWPLHFLAYAIIQGITGGSLGKLAVGIRVVTADGQICGIGRSLLRTFLWIADAFTCGIPILGGILLLSTKGHRRVGDMAAKTFVVPKEAVGRPVSVPGLTGGYGTAGYAQGYSGYGQQGWPPAGAPGSPGAPGGPAAGGWAAPPATGQPAGAPAAPTGEGPTWDAARNAYIQYDREQAAWVQWNDEAKAWRPIDT